MNEKEELLTMSEVAKRCRVGIWRIRRAAANREIEFIDFALPRPNAKRASKMRRFRPIEVDRWLHNQNLPVKIK